MPDPNTTPTLNDLLSAAQSGMVQGTTDRPFRTEDFGSTGFEPLNKYDIGIRRGMDQGEYRASKQTGWQALGNALAQSASKIGLGTLEGIGYLTDLPQWKALALNEEREFGNWFSDLMLSGQEAVAEKMPIYGGEKAFDPGNPRWWMANLPNIASSISLMIPAMGATRLTGMAGRLMRGASRLERLALQGGKVGERAKTLMTVKKGVTSALFSRYMENTMEAHEAAQSRYNDLISQGVEENEALEQAGIAGSNTWYANVANLVTDIPQYMLLMRPGAAIAKASQESKSAAKRIGKEVLAVGSQALSEGAEEGYQYAIQRASAEASNPFQTIQKAMANLPEYSEDDEFWGSVLLGAAGGTIFDVAGKGFNKVLSKTMDRYRSAASAYGAGDYVQGMFEKYQEAQDMIFRGEQSRLQEVMQFSDDDAIKPMVDRLIAKTEQLRNSGIADEGVLRETTNAFFYNDMLSNLAQEAINLSSESNGKVNVDAIAAEVIKNIPEGDNKQESIDDVLKIFGLDNEIVSQAGPLKGVNKSIYKKLAKDIANIAVKTHEYLGNADRAQQEVDDAVTRGTPMQFERRITQVGENQFAFPKEELPEDEGRTSAPLEVTDKQIKQYVRETTTNATAESIRRRLDGIKARGEDHFIPHFNEVIADKMREEFDEVNPMHFSSFTEYIKALEEKEFIAEFSDEIKTGDITIRQGAQKYWLSTHKSPAQEEDEVTGVDRTEGVEEQPVSISEEGQQQMKEQQKQAILGEVDQKRAEQKGKIRLEDDGTYTATYKSPVLGVESTVNFETKEGAQSWLDQKYDDDVAKLNYEPAETNVSLSDEVHEERIDYGSPDEAASSSLLEQSTFNNEGEQVAIPQIDNNQRREYGKRYLFGITLDAIIEEEDGKYKPAFKDGNLRTHKGSIYASIWDNTQIPNTASYEESQAIVRHLADNVNWKNTEVHLEVDPTITYHAVHANASTPHANPLSKHMDYTEGQIEGEKKRFFARNKSMPADQLKQAWAVEESYMRLPGARGADLMNVSYVIYTGDQQKVRVPLGIQYGYDMQNQKFGTSRNSQYWTDRYELWKKWVADSETTSPVRLSGYRFARDTSGNPIYMAGRFLDHPNGDFPLDNDNYKLETRPYESKHLVLMVATRQAQGTVVEHSTPIPKGRIMNTGNYTPGFPHILVKDTMGNYVWSRAYSRTMKEAPRAKEELTNILKPVIDAKQAFINKLTELGIDVNADALPQDVRNELMRYTPGVSNRIKRADARFKEVFDFIESGWKRVDNNLKTLYRWKESSEGGVVVYGPNIDSSILFRHLESNKPASQFSVDNFIKDYDLESRPLQIDVNRIGDVEYVDSIAWRLKTNTNPVHPLVSPTFFYEKAPAVEVAPMLVPTQEKATREERRDAANDIISYLYSTLAQYEGQDINKLPVMHAITFKKLYDTYTPLGETDREFNALENNIGEEYQDQFALVKKMFTLWARSKWSDGHYRGRFKEGYTFTEEAFKESNDFDILRIKETDRNPDTGQIIEKGKMVISHVVSPVLYQQEAVGERPILKARGKVYVYMRPDETIAPIDQTAPLDPSSDTQTGEKRFYGSGRRDRRPPKFKVRDIKDHGIHKLDKEKAVQWLSGKIPSDIAVRIMDLDYDTFGFTTDALITLSTAAPQSTAYHEALHAVLWNLCTDEEIETILQAAKQEYEKSGRTIPAGKDPNEEYEEMIAYGFEEYAINRGKPKTVLEKFFERILNWIRDIVGNRSVIEKFYSDIYNGEYAKRKVVSRPFIRYSRTPGLTIEEQRAAVDIIMQLVDERIDEAVEEREKLRRSKSIASKKDKIEPLDSDYADILNLKTFFSQDGVIGDLFDIGTDPDISYEQKSKIATIIKGLNSTVHSVDFEKSSLEVTGQIIADQFVPDKDAPGPLYFHLLKALSERGIRVKIRGSKASFSEDNIGRSDNEPEFSEGEEDTREWWAIANYSISPKDKLTARLQRWISRLPKVTDEGTFVPDPFGIGMTLNYSPHEVYPILQAVLGNSTSVEDMMDKILEDADVNPIMYSILSRLENWNTDMSVNQLATQLFTHVAQKVDPEYTVVRHYNNAGVNKIVVFPSGSKKESAITNTILSGIQKMSKQQLSDAIKLFEEKVEMNAARFASLMRSVGYYVNARTINKIIEKGTDNTIATNIRNALKAAEKDNIQDAAKVIFNTARKYMAPMVVTRQQNVHLDVKGSKTYAWTNANFLARQVERLKRNFEQMQEFYQSDPLYAPDGKLIPLLREKQPFDLIYSDGIKYEGQRVGKKYTKFSDRDMLVTMLAYYDNDIYMLPSFNDATVLSGVRLSRDKSLDNSIEDILDVAYSEWLRMQRDNGSLGDVKNYSKNSKEAMLFPDILMDGSAVISKFDRDKLRNDLRNNLDEQARVMVEKLKSLGILSKTGLNNQFVDSNIKDTDTFVKEFIASHMAVHSQFVMMFMGDPAFYNNVGDFFKRSKEVISPGIYLNDKAIFKSKDGSFVDLSRKKFMKLGLFSDIVVGSSLSKELEALGLLNKFGKFSLTDGQTYIDPISYRDREVGLARWDDEKDDHLNIVMNGELPRKYNRDGKFQPFKPFAFSLLKTNDGRIKPVQKKDSEIVVYPFYGRKVVNGVKNQFYNPFYRAILEQMGYSFVDTSDNTSVTYNESDRKFDMIGSDSTIKVGASGVGSFPVDENGNSDYSDAASAFGNMEVHNIPITDWRLQQETPPHHLGSDAVYGIQLMKLITSDLDAEGEYTMPDGKKISGANLINRYKALIAKDIGVSTEEVEKLIVKAKNDEKAFSDVISVLRQEVLDRGMPTRFYDGMEVVKHSNGNIDTLIPLSHPLHSNRIEGLLNSIVRNKITKRKFDNGFAFVNASAAGFSKMPKIVFNEDGSVKHYEVYAPIHDKRLLTFTNSEGFIDANGMKEIERHPSFRKLLDAVVYRTPTEYKYSIFPIHIIGFLPTDDGVIYMPPEITKIAGLDFDIDKVRGFYYAVPKDNADLLSRHKRDNEKIDLMRAALSSVESAKQMLEPGGFDNIEKTNLTIRRTKNWEKLEGVQKITHDTIDKVERSLHITDPMTQVRVAKRFNAGQDLISIAAVNNAVHSIWSQLPKALSYQHPIVIEKGGKNIFLSKINEQKDISGEYITKNIASTVAAFVDNGKNPQAEFFNMNDYTANVAYYMLHSGVDMETVQYFLAQPAIVWWTESINNNNGEIDSNALNIAMRKAGRTAPHHVSNYTMPLNKDMLKQGLSRTYFTKEHSEAEFEEYAWKMLDNFLVYAKRASHVNTLVQLTKAGDKGLGTSQIDNYGIINSYYRFANNEKNPFSGWEQIFDDQNEYMAKFFFDGIFSANKWIVDFMGLPDITVGTIDTLINHMNDLKGSMLTKDELSMLYNSIYDFLISHDKNFAMEDMLGSKLWDRIGKLPESVVNNNMLLSSLRMEGEDLTIPEATLLDYGEEELFTEAWRKLISIDEELAKELARYSVMRNGFRYAPGGFSHLQPLEMYTQQFSDLYDNYKDAMAILQGSGEKALLFADQFIRNNYTRTSFVPHVDTVESTAIKVDGEIVAYTIPADYGAKRFYHNDSYLYKLTGVGEFTLYYERTPSFGPGAPHKIYQEYYFDRSIDDDQDSIFEKELDEDVKAKARKSAEEFMGEDFNFDSNEHDLLDACN